MHSEQTFVGTIMPVRHSVVGSAVAGSIREARHAGSGLQATSTAGSPSRRGT
mgnify:CR=1 FL=1